MGRSNYKYMALEAAMKVVGLNPASKPDVEKFPDVLKAMVRALMSSQNLIAVTFVYEPGSDRIRNVALSPFQPTPETWTLLSNAAGTLGKRFNNTALEAMQHVGEKQGVGRAAKTRQDDERGTGAGDVRHEVGQVSPGDAASDPAGE